MDLNALSHELLASRGRHGPKRQVTVFKPADDVTDDFAIPHADVTVPVDDLPDDGMKGSAI